MSQFEIETTLVLCSDDPETIADEIAELAEIGAAPLIHRQSLAIHDVYLDRSDGKLRAIGFGLRTRVVNGRQLVTLKGEPRGVRGGGVRREEIELAWSADALETLIAKLAEGGVVLSVPSAVAVEDGPLTVFGAMGFFAEQTRDTRRRPRDVLAEERSDSPVAELAIDSVTYRFSLGDVRHHEVEVELKGDGSIDLLHKVSEDLLALWPSHLRSWKWGKRATGKAVESIAAESGLGRLVSASGDLKPQSYDLISARLE